MSIFLPKGIKSGEVIDPDFLGEEFIRAAKVAGETSQYQWTDGSFQDNNNSDMDLLKPGAAVKIQEASQSVFLRYGATDWHTGLTGQAPDLTVASGDPNLYHIPYFRGYSLITGTTDMKVDWTSTYPELVMVIFSYQIITKAYFDAVSGGSSNELSPQIRINVVLDGSSIVGAGVKGTLDNIALRGQGCANPAARSTTTGMALTSAGNHSVEVQASQPEVLDSTYHTAGVAWGGGSHTGHATPPDEGVCIGNRTLIVLRFPRGEWIGG